MAQQRIGCDQNFIECLLNVFQIKIQQFFFEITDLSFRVNYISQMLSKK